MSPAKNYHKTYRGVHKKTTRHRGFRFVTLIGITLFDTVVFIVAMVIKVLSFALRGLIPLTRSVGKILLRTVLLPLYGALVKKLRRRHKKNITPPKSNRFFFLFTNRYVAHTVAILIVIITVAQNISIRDSRAEDFGRAALLAELSPGQYFTDEITEEEIIISPFYDEDPHSEAKQDPRDERSPALTGQIGIGSTENTDTSAALAQGGSAIIKPDVAETADTPKPRASTLTYTVEPNDTVYDIAEQFRISVNTILWANKLSSRSIIRPGDKLKILPVSGIEHSVKRNETISSIAKKFKIPQEDILEINQLATTATLTIGQSLVIPDGRPLSVPRPPSRQLATAPRTSSTKTSGGGFIWPTTCRKISQYYRGWRHTGIDIACGNGIDIYAVEEGVVEKASWSSGGYGNRIVIRHPDGTKTLYAHIKARGILVSPGEYVKKGQVIAYMGSTGRSTGPHVHFEVIVRGSRVNPFNWL